jgi:hypothetical protein
MRQVGDTLVWLGLILVVSAVVYYTPRFASYVTASEADTIPLNASVQSNVGHTQPLASRHTFRNVNQLAH